jgi:uncharacterized membrane protein
MSLLVHESHPILVHGPLALLPAAAGVDLVAAIRGDPGLIRAGRDLWLAGTLSGLLAGLTGMAASQEVSPGEKSARDMMLLHGIGNLLIVSGALGMSLWRLRHRPTAASSLLGVLAVTAAAYTGYLGGEMVYSHELGVKRRERVRRSPPLFSRQAPGELARDALRGARWLLANFSRALRGEEKLERAAFRGDGVGAGGFQQAAQTSTS